MLERIFAERFAETMKAAGVNQGELAQAANCTQPDISHYLKGRIPSGVRLVRLAQALGTTAEDLLGMGSSTTPMVVIRDSEVEQRAARAERKLADVRRSLEQILVKL